MKTKNRIWRYHLIVMGLLIILDIACKKEVKLPTISTIAVSQVTDNSAVSGGNITNDGGASVAGRGLVWNVDQQPTLETNKGFTTEGEGVGVFSSTLNALTAGITYNVRAYATNSAGTAYGADISFSTLGQAPSCITQSATNILATGATLNGTVNANDLSTKVTFEYGTSTAYGQTVTATQSPVTGNTITNVSADITGLTVATIFHFRIKAVNSLGTTYGSDMTFTTLGTVTDIDGNVYNTVTIGTQVWMKENLKTTKYNDGTSIPNITDDAAWDIYTIGAYSDYSNTPANSTTYGRLYNWYTVDNNAYTKVFSNGGKNVCPTGWHAPSNDEWTTLTDYLTNNGYGYEGSRYDIGKSMAATSGWATDPSAGNVGNDQTSNNSSGFTALPGGYSGWRIDGIGYSGYWWSSTQSNSSLAWQRFMNYNKSSVYSSFANFSGKQYCFSVRCLRDN